MSIAELIRAMSAAGAPLEAITLAVDAIEKKDAELRAAQHEDETRRATARDKKRRQRAAAREASDANVPETVPGQSRDMSGTVPADVPFSPAPNKSPPHPQKLTPTPCVQDAPTCESPIGVPLHARLSAAQIAIALVLAGLSHRRWKETPPPVGVTDELWQAFIDYRRQKREALTIGAYRPLAKRLGQFADDDEWPPGRIVEEIMDRGWLTFKPEWLQRKTDRRHGQRPHHQPEQGELLNPMAAAAARSLARSDRGRELPLD